MFKVKGFPQPGITPILNTLLRQNLVIKTDNQLNCHILLAEEAARRAVQAGHFEPMLKALQDMRRGFDSSNSPYFHSYHLQGLRQLRIAFYRGDMARIPRILEFCERNFSRDFAQYLAEQALLRGDPARARQYLTPHASDYDQALRGWLGRPPAGVLGKCPR